MPNEKVHDYIAKSIGMFDDIPDTRKALLKELAEFVELQLTEGNEAKLTFICTHNSRRSHMAQIWAQTAAAQYGIPHVETFSGGTEATAFNPRAVAALKRAGFEIEKTNEEKNPLYHVRYHAEAPPMAAFSKVYNHKPNPDNGFCAVMTCSDADEACPIVSGAEKRIAITYVDPKAHDDTDQETAAYDERCRQISSEMLYAFSQVTVSAPRAEEN